MRLREAVRFSLTAVRFAIVDSKRFWIAPKLLRRLFTAVSAASTRPMVVFAFDTDVTDVEFSAELPSEYAAAVKPTRAAVPPTVIDEAELSRMLPT